MPSMIDFRGEHGTPYAVYEAERDTSGNTNEVLAAYGLGAIPASNDRIGGAQLMLRFRPESMIQSGQGMC